MMRALLLVPWLLGPATAAADGLDSIAGHYVYTDYHVSLPNGKVLGLSDIGAREATLDVSASGTMTLRMKMSSGAVVTQTARVLETHVDNGVGYWIARWPDMAYPVRAQFHMSSATLTTETKFENRADTERFGSVERAILRRTQ
jgi:hypothetical protein